MLTLALCSLLLAQAPLGEDPFVRGVAALRAKDADGAIAALSACVDQAPARADCRWELGWAHWLKGDLEQVATHWAEVVKLDPSHPEAQAKLAEVTSQLELKRSLAQSAQGAPLSFVTPPPDGASVRIRAVGDVMLGTDFPEGYLPPEDGAQLLAKVKELLVDAELTFVNLEGPLCDDPAPSTKCKGGGNCYAFRTPTRYGRYLLEAGVDLASTANNHSGDFGEVCRRQTERALDGLGIAWSGPPGSIATVERNGLRIGLVAFHTSGATNNVNDLPTARALVRKAAATHHLVIVSFHGGAEGAKALHVPHGKETFFGENRGALRTFAHAVVDEGADLVLGHGPHVVRAMEIYKERLVAYSLGNFATYGRFNLAGPLGLGVVLEVTLDAQGRFAGGRLFPTRQVGQGVPEPDPSGAVLGYVRRLSAEDFPHTGVQVAQDGTLGAPAPSPQAPADAKVRPAGGTKPTRR
jgi:hypothetical protein